MTSPGNDATGRGTIREVWADNLEEEFDRIRDAVENYQFISMDTEFPGIVARPTGHVVEYNYQTVKCNVDLLKVIQLGITLADSKGNVSSNTSTWQFNFRFDLETDMYAQDSIEFLIDSGVDFELQQRRGIELHDFGELIMSSGLVMNEDVVWISFHGCYDFGYLLKLLTCQPLPSKENQFFELLKDFFPSLYDIKYLLRNVNNFSLVGGYSLQNIAEHLNVQRVGPQHQAGSDSLVTSRTFFELMEKYFDDSDTTKYLGVIYGLGDSASVSKHRGNSEHPLPVHDVSSSITFPDDTSSGDNQSGDSAINSNGYNDLRTYGLNNTSSYENEKNSSGNLVTCGSTSTHLPSNNNQFHHVNLTSSTSNLRNIANGNNQTVCFNQNNSVTQSNGIGNVDGTHLVSSLLVPNSVNSSIISNSGNSATTSSHSHNTIPELSYYSYGNSTGSNSGPNQITNSDTLNPISHNRSTISVGDSNGIASVSTSILKNPNLSPSFTTGMVSVSSTTGNSSLKTSATHSSSSTINQIQSNDSLQHLMGFFPNQSQISSGNSTHQRDSNSKSNHVNGVNVIGSRVSTQNGQGNGFTFQSSIISSSAVTDISNISDMQNVALGNQNSVHISQAAHPTSNFSCVAGHLKMIHNDKSQNCMISYGSLLQTKNVLPSVPRTHNQSMQHSLSPSHTGSTNLIGPHPAVSSSCNPISSSFEACNNNGTNENNYNSNRHKSNVASLSNQSPSILNVGSNGIISPVSSPHSETTALSQNLPTSTSHEHHLSNSSTVKQGSSNTHKNLPYMQGTNGNNDSNIGTISNSHIQMSNSSKFTSQSEVPSTTSSNNSNISSDCIFGSCAPPMYSVLDFIHTPTQHTTRSSNGAAL